GFGGGAIIGSPLKQYLIETFYRPPVYLGTIEAARPVTENGRRDATLDGQRREVGGGAPGGGTRGVGGGEPAGLRGGGRGRGGRAGTFFTLGAVYFLVMIVAAFSYRLPAPGWTPARWTPPAEEETRRKMMSTHHVAINEAMKTPQFWLLWVVLCLNVTAGIG